MDNPVQKAIKLRSEAIAIYYEDKGSMRPSEVIAQAETIGPEINLGVDLKGVHPSQMEAEARRYLPIVVKGLNLYLHRIGEISHIKQQQELITRDAERKQEEIRKFEKEQKVREKLRKDAEKEISKSLEEEKKRYNEAMAKEKEAIEKEVAERRAAENPYKIIGVPQNASSEEIKSEASKQILERDLGALEAEMRLSGASEDVIQKELQKRSDEIDAIKSAANRLSTEEKRKVEDTKLASLTEPEKGLYEEGFIIKFLPQIGKDERPKQTVQALKDTREYRENVKYGWGIEFDDQYIANLKKSGFIPQHYSTKEANDTINIAHLVFAQTGDYNVLRKAINQSKFLSVQEREKLNVVANKVAYLQVSNPVLAANLKTGSRITEIDLSKGNIFDAKNQNNQIALKLENNILVNAFEKVKLETSKIFNKNLRAFTKKSFESKVAKKLISKLALVGFDTAVNAAIVSASAATGPLAPIVAAILKGSYWLLKKLLGPLIVALKRWVDKFIRENKEVFTFAGLSLIGAGLLGSGSYLILTGVGVLFGVAVTAGPVAVITTVGGAMIAGFTFIVSAVFISSLTVVGITILAIALLTLFIVFITNNTGYVVPIGNFESGLAGITPADCLGTPPPIPDAGIVKFSADRKYAYPVGQFQVPGYSCYHWDGNKAADIFSPLTRPPILAMEDGRIVGSSTSDPLGGKYLILQGTTSGRHYYYAHLCHLYVTGGSVRAGQVIGTMDETGSGRVQHLHFAINTFPLSNRFEGGDGNVCPQKDFEDKFQFGVCTTFCDRSS